MELFDSLKYLKKFLHIEREIVGLQQLKNEPPTEEVYQDKNHICYMIGEVIEEGKTFCTILDNHVCLLGCAATGLDPGLSTLDSTDRSESDYFHVSGINIFPTEEIQAISEREASLLFPHFKEGCKAIRIGPLVDVPESEIAVFIANPEQVHKLTRAYCYATGHFIRGFAGMGACRMLFPSAFINKEPAFTVSDRSWRKALQLNPNELTLVFPVDKLQILVENLDESNKEWSI
jgi:uncharacterized protein (DUF169 family)